MKTTPRAIGTLILVSLGIFINGSAMAGYRGHAHGHDHGHKKGLNVRIGVSIGMPVYALRYFPAPFYTVPVYAVPAPVYIYPTAIRHSSPPVYVERDSTQIDPPPSKAQNDWYYCASSQTYYPYVKECSGGWQRVPAQPSSR